MTRRNNGPIRLGLGIVLALLCAARAGSAQDITLDPARADDQVRGWYLSAYDDAGNPGRQPHLRTGADYLFPQAEIPLSVARSGHPVRTAAFGDEVRFSWEGLKQGARYRLRLTFLADSPRMQRITVNGRIIVEELALSANRILYCIADLPSPPPSGTYDLSIERITGPNAVVSIVELFSNQGRLLPDPVLEAYGDCSGRVEGIVWDRNRPDTPYSGVEVSTAIPDLGLKLAVESGQDGSFGFQVPRAWKTSGRQEVLVTAELPTGSLTRRLSMRGIFPPQLTPRPARSIHLSDPRIELNGIWRFHPDPPNDFPGLDAQGTADWDPIRVPGEWAMQGFSVPREQAAAYWREFVLPGDWRNLRCILRCDAVYSDAVVYVNGRRAGDHRGGFTAFELDVTDLVIPGINTLALAVTNESLEDILASGSQYAAHPLGGITRKMALWAVPPCRITRLDATTFWDSAYRDATLELDVEVSNSTKWDIEQAVLWVSLKSDKHGQPVAITPERIALPSLPSGDVTRGKISLQVPEPLKWDSEHPNLYTFRCILEYGGRIREVVRRRIGFRQIEVRGNRLLVNGRPVKLRGINRHEAHPLLGRSLIPRLWRRDAELYRAANINYIRTSHYPPAEEFLEACDELGLYVECEAPLCWVQHGANTNWRRPGWDYRDRKYFPPLLLANLESIELNRHHPSLILWSLANESRWSPLFADVLERVRELDPSRPTVFHDQCWGEYNNAGSRADIANFHYPGPGGPDRAAGIGRPLLFGEYCHLNAYNRYELVTDPGLRDAWGPPFQAMWERIYATEGIVGGAIWSGIDDAFHLPGGPTVGYGTWGPLDGWRRTKPEYWHIKKAYSPIRLLTQAISDMAEGLPLIVELENRHDFSDLEELRIEWSLSDGRRGRTTARIPPKNRGTLTVPVMGSGSLDGETLILEFFSPQGFSIDTFRIALGTPRPPEAPHQAPKGESKPLDLKQDASAISVTGDGFQMTLDRKTGGIRELVYHDSVIVKGGPELLLLPLNREGGTQMTPDAQEFAPFTDTCRGWRTESVSAFQVTGGVSIRIRGTYRQASGDYSFLINNSGDIDLEFRFIIKETVEPRQIGLVFRLPREYDILEWSRSGQWSVYPDHHLGRLLGRAEAFPVSDLTGPAGPRQRPDVPWASDSTSLGSHDFRSTKSHIYWASLTDAQGQGVVVHSDGSQHVRSWIERDAVSLLVADYSNAGAERFFARYAQSGYRTLNPGTEVSGRIRLGFRGPNSSKNQ